MHGLATRLVTRLAAALPETGPTGSNDLVLPPHLLAIAASAATAVSSSSSQSAPDPTSRTRRLTVRGAPGAAVTVPATSPIVPLLTRSPRPLSAYLRTKGYLVRPITYPTVPRGEERIRVCLHAENTERDVDGLVEALREWVRSGAGAKKDNAGSHEGETKRLAKKAAGERQAAVVMKARL